MARNLSPILLRNGISRIWNNNSLSIDYVTSFSSYWQIFLYLKQFFEIRFQSRLVNIKFYRMLWNKKIMLFANIIPITSPTFKERRLKLKIKIFRKKIKKLLIKRLIREKMKNITKSLSKNAFIKAKSNKKQLYKISKILNKIETKNIKLKCLYIKKILISKKNTNFLSLLKKYTLNHFKKTFYWNTYKIFPWRKFFFKKNKSLKNINLLKLKNNLNTKVYFDIKKLPKNYLVKFYKKPLLNIIKLYKNYIKIYNKRFNFFFIEMLKQQFGWEFFPIIVNPLAIKNNDLQKRNKRFTEISRLWKFRVPKRFSRHFKEKFFLNTWVIFLFFMNFPKIPGISDLLAERFAYEMERDKRHWPYVKILKKFAKISSQKNKDDYNILKITFSGRLRGSTRTRKVTVSHLKRNFALQKFTTVLNFSNAVANTVYGAVNIGVWIYYPSEI